MNPASAGRYARAHLAVSRVAWWALVGIGLVLGLGDIAEISPVNTALLTGVHTLAPLAIGLTLVSAVRSGAVANVPRGLMLSIAAWLAVVTLSAALAPSHRSEALATLARPVTGVLLAWTVCQVCASRTQWLRLAQALAAGGVLIAAGALAEAAGFAPVQAWLDSLQAGDVPIGDVPRVAASLSHPNEAAVLLEVALPVLIAWAWSTQARWRAVLFVGAGATLAAIVLTFSRAGLVAALAALGTMAIVSTPARRDRLTSLGLLVLIAPLTLGWAALVDPGLDRRLLAGLDESSAQQPARSEFWTVALQMVRDRPLLGVGPDNFRWRFSEYSGEYPAEDNLGIHAHNQYLEALSDTGVLGFAAFIGLCAMLARVAVARSGHEWPWRAALLASLVAWLTHALLDDFERFWPPSVAFWLIVGLIARDYPARWVSPLMRSAVPRARVSSSPVTLPRPSSTEPLI